ncbi:MAG: acyltransferase family protein, partial [Clostridia bacterium]|nr:acyltransferase family protein [Clostridia bacterium]
RWAGKGYFEDYISQDRIQPIKGIFILLVFISHFVQYVPLEGILHEPYLEMKAWLGQMVVVPFLFYSGYGVTESIRKKGSAYVRSMPTRRILMVLFQFDVAVLLFIALQAVLGKTFPLRTMLFSLIGWMGVGNSNWYILAILVLYLCTFVAFWVFEDPKREWIAHLTVTALAVIFILFMRRHRDGYWYNTVMAYVAGGWYSLFRKKIENFDRSNKFYGFALVVLAVGFYVLRRTWGSLVAYEISAVVFALLIVCVTAKVQIRNPFLAYCGKHLFSLFILQRLPMLALQNTVVAENTYVYFIVCFVLTFGLAASFDFVIPRVWKGLLQLGERFWKNGKYFRKKTANV